jgi:hypothetical protein
MPLLFQKHVHREDLKANPSVFYVFGDNEARKGYGGQAFEMRGEPNSIGIPTKKTPFTFWSDRDLEDNCRTLDEHFRKLHVILQGGATVVFPLMGIGTGLSNMKEECPITWLHLQKCVDELCLTYAGRNDILSG